MKENRRLILSTKRSHWKKKRHFFGQSVSIEFSGYGSVKVYNDNFKYKCMPLNIEMELRI